MTDTFNDVKSLIENGKWGDFLVPDLHPFSEGCHQRLANALVAVGNDNESTPLELAGLIRHILKREDEDIQGGISQTLKVPRYYPYPDKREVWEKCGVKILRESSEYFLICADSWLPDWLDCSATVEKDLFAEVERRNYVSVEGDNFLKLVGLTHYRSIGQQEAIRAVLTAPPNATLVINLPTGAGKSLCAQLPALLKSGQGGVSVVIVPTTALALDQERSLLPHISHPTAYYGDSSHVGQQRRKEIRQRIRQGTQGIVFTSPESLIYSLSPCLYEAAKRGYLRYFIIDEAHIVEQWGDGFRPAFQEISGLRKDLLRYTAFNTLLLTATLTESCLDTLETLFGQSGEFKVISAVQLRPEVAYGFVKCADEEERQQRLLEAVSHLPRPMIIYATKREDVYRWSEVLSQAGFKRFGVMTGESSPEERLELIQNWREKKLDIVIATSAFGLGVDQQDVRCVIHVCIPETIDRFYQEVGRGGRDGKAAISLTLYTDDDYKIAAFLNEQSSITLERGLQRWTSMFNAKTPMSEGSYRVSLDVPPSLSDKDIDMNNQQNRHWNSRTLTLMSQAGLIEINWEHPPQRKDFPSDTEYQKAYESYHTSRIIRIKHEFHLKWETWEDYIEPIRQQRSYWNTRNLELMKEALAKRPTRCLSEIFQEAYTIPARDKPIARKSINVSVACGACPWCRQQNKNPFAQIMPHPGPVWQSCTFSLGEELQRVLKGENLLLIFYDAFHRQKCDRLIQWFIGQGVSNLISPVPLEISLAKDKVVFLYDEYEPIQLYPLPTLIYHPLSLPFEKTYLYPKSVSVPHIILLPVDTPDPNRSDRRLIDIFNGRGFRLDVFYSRSQETGDRRQN